MQYYRHATQKNKIPQIVTEAKVKNTRLCKERQKIQARLKSWL
jgi:hypothetical protein